MKKMLWGLCFAVAVFSLSAQTTYYVDAARSDDSGNGLSWATAKKSIQTAIGLVFSNDTIVVTNGTYAPISITNNLSIHIRSVNGADVTIIDGGKTNSCATLGTDYTHTNTVLTGFTLCNGSASMGGGSSRGTLNNCILSGNTASFGGGGSVNGTLNNCTLSNNTAAWFGGGVYYGTLNNCTLIGNMASKYGGGSYGGMLNNCTLIGNTALQYGGGSYGGMLNNCILSGNTASYGGGSTDGTLNNCRLSGNRSLSNGGGSSDGTLNNCTLFGNTATSYGGGSYKGTLNNCIVWNNTAPNGNNYSGVTFNYSCSYPVPSGFGNIGTDPLFVNAASTNLRLRAGSPCINAGANGYVSIDMDLDGNLRIAGGIVDMGAYEYASSPPLLLPQAELVITSPGAKTYGDADFQLETTGGSGTGVVTYSLVSGSAVVSSSGLVKITGVGSIVVQATKAADANYNLTPSANLTIIVNRTTQTVYYVNAAMPDDLGNGLSWMTAKKSIQAAIGLVFSNDTIVVTNGIYAPISVTNDMSVLIQSVNGAAVTIIDGGKTNRCASLGSKTNTVLTGFTLCNGYALHLYNSSGGGSCGGTLNNCILRGNEASPGGGSSFGTLNNCTLRGNNGWQNGGGSDHGTLNNCTLIGNTSAYGGGSSHGTLNNCKLIGNQASAGGGGSWNGTLNNCTLFGNTATSYGGGSYSSDFDAMPITLNNCIVWGNTAPNGDNYWGGTFNYSCSYPVPSGVGNIGVDPLFVSSSGLDLRLRVGSPCINKGSNVEVSGETDLDGNPRISGGQIDMGSYEFTLPNQAPLAVVAVGSKVYGDAPFQLATTGGSSTGTVSYLLVSGPGTVSPSGLVTITGTGDIVVQATKAGDDNYNSVTSANLSITVNKATQMALMITSPGTKMYGDASFQLATTGGSSTGTVSYLLISGPGTVSSSGLVTITGAGSIVVQATKAADDNYSSVISANLSITVSKASQTVTYWKFQDGSVGTYAGTLDNAANPGFLVAAGQAGGTGVKPQFSATVPGPKIYSGRYNGTLVNAENSASLFFLPKTNGWDVVNNYYNTTEGGYVRVTNNPALWLTNFTMECFVKIDQKSRFSLVVGMQRTSLSGTGVTWGMDEDNIGGIKVRWDVQETNYTGSSGGWNNGLPSKPLLNDGKWHHLALTYSYTNRTFKYYVDYSLYQQANAISNLQYTATDPMLLGGYGGGSSRIFNGWIDEVRYSSAVLSPDEFLMTNTIPLVSDTDTMYWNFESQPFVCKGFPVQTMDTNNAGGAAYYPVISADIWSNQTKKITEGKQSLVYWNTNNARSVLFSAVGGNYGQLVAPGKYHPTNFTVEAMVKVRSTVSSWPLIVGKVREYDSPSFSLSLESGYLRTRFDCYTNTAVWPGYLPLAERPPGFNWCIPSSAFLTNGVWYHVAFTYSNRVVRMYRNYQQVASNTTPYPIVMTDGDFNVGRGAGEAAVDGWIDEVRITPEVLPPSRFLYTAYRESTMILLR